MRESGVRVIRRADLVGVGLVASPSYQGNRVEVRQRIGEVSSRIPLGEPMDCRCADGCQEAMIEDVEVSPTALTIRRGYAEALGSRERGTLRVNVDEDSILVAVDVPDTSYSRHRRTRRSSSGPSWTSLPQIPRHHPLPDLEGRPIAGLKHGGCVLAFALLLALPAPSWAQEVLTLRVQSVEREVLRTRELIVSVASFGESDDARITPFSLSVKLRTRAGTVDCFNDHTVWPAEEPFDGTEEHDLTCSPPGFVEWPPLSNVQSATVEVMGERLFDRNKSYRCTPPERTNVGIVSVCAIRP